MPVNILYIIDSLTHGGTEKQLVQLIRLLDRERFRPHICTLKTSEGFYDQLDIPKLCLDFVNFGHPSIVKKIFALTTFIRQQQIHIVQTFFQDPFLLGAMIKPFNRVKLIGSFRDLGFWRTATESLKMRLAYPFFAGFVANSRAVKDHFVQRDRISPEKIEVIYNGIDLKKFLPKSVEEFAKKPAVVGIVANLNRPVKRVQDFIQAAGLVHQKCQDVRFVVIGDGHLRNELEMLGNTLGLRDVLTFTGRLASPLDVACSFHIGVITSETEGLCNAILEYMACNTMVVATDTGGNPELIQDGENGYLYSVGNVQALADIVVRIINHPEQKAALAHSGLKTVEDLFSSEVMITKYQDFYSNLLGL